MKILGSKPSIIQWIIVILEILLLHTIGINKIIIPNKLFKHNSKFCNYIIFFKDYNYFNKTENCIMNP